MSAYASTLSRPATMHSATWIVVEIDMEQRTSPVSASFLKVTRMWFPIRRVPRLQMRALRHGAQAALSSGT